MAAAFAALVSLQNNLLLIQNHPRHSFTFEKEQLKSLVQCVNFLIDFMKSYDKSFGARREAAEALEMRIARAAQKAEDVIETHVVDQIHGGKTRSSNKGSSRFLLDLQNVIEDMNFMRRKAINVRALSGMEAEMQPTFSAAAAAPASNQTTTKMVGCDDVLIQLLDQLTGFPSSRQVIPIVGMAGIGKTTLATNAFKDPLTVYHFDICLWASISQQYWVEKIQTQLLRVDESLGGTVDELGEIAPYEIWEMLQLRHLEVNPICLLDPVPVERLVDEEENDLVLRDLHTLSVAQNFRLSEEVFKRIPNIRRLILSYFDEASFYYCPNNLCYFRKLEFLYCEFDHRSKWRDFAVSLTFPTSLNMLCLSGCGVDWEELTMMVGTLPNLATLQLYPHSVIGSEWSPVEGNFLRLKHLEIRGCDELVYWNADNTHFPVLENLRLQYLSKLDEFPSGIGEIPTFQRMFMEYCSKSSSISAMRTLVEEEEQENEGVRLHVIFRGDKKTIESFKEEIREEGLTSKNLSLDLRTVKLKGL